MAKKNLLDELIRCRKDQHNLHSVEGDPSIKWCSVCGTLFIWDLETDKVSVFDRPLVTQELDSRNGE